MKRLVFIAILIVSVFIIQNLVRSIFTLWQKHDLLVKAEKELALEKKKNQEIKHDLAMTQSADFIEKEARNKLFLVKPGESKVLIDEQLLKKAMEASKQAKQEAQKPNWQQWWELFF